MLMIGQMQGAKGTSGGSGGGKRRGRNDGQTVASAPSLIWAESESAQAGQNHRQLRASLLSPTTLVNLHSCDGRKRPCSPVQFLQICSICCPLVQFVQSDKILQQRAPIQRLGDTQDSLQQDQAQSGEVGEGGDKTPERAWRYTQRSESF